MKNLEMNNALSQWLKARTIRLLAGTGAVMVFLSGCGGSDTKSSVSTIEEMAEEQKVDLLKDDKYVLQVLMLKNDSDEKFVVGYFKETDGILYFEDAIDESQTYNLSYLQGMSDKLVFYYCSASDVLPPSAVFDTYATIEQLERIINYSQWSPDRSEFQWWDMDANSNAIGHKSSATRLDPINNIDIVIADTTFSIESIKTKSHE